jgi:hypothetical protein
MGATRWGDAQMRMICDLIQGAGHDVELHLHPVVARIDGFKDEWDILWRHDLATQTRLIGLGVEILQRCGVQRVTAFRAGALAANEDTLQAMETNGLLIGSNRDRDLKSSLESKVNDAFPVVNDISRRGRVTDIPVSTLRSGLPWMDGPFRHLEICAVSALEMQDGLRKLARAGVQCATILTHAKEFFYMAGGKAVPIRKNMERLERLAAWLADWPEARVMTVAQCAGLTGLPVASPPDVRLNPLLTMARVGEQAAYRLHRKLHPVRS